jgi:DNA-binding GntR family transcriptional regulator
LLVDPLSEKIIDGQIKPGAKIKVRVQENSLKIG